MTVFYNDLDDDENFERTDYFTDTGKPNRVVNGTTAYRCTKCGQYKTKGEFYKDRRVPCGIRSRCIKCYHGKR